MVRSLPTYCIRFSGGIDLEPCCLCEHETLSGQIPTFPPPPWGWGVGHSILSIDRCVLSTTRYRELQALWGWGVGHSIGRCMHAVYNTLSGTASPLVDQYNILSACILTTLLKAWCPLRSTRARVQYCMTTVCRV